VQRFDIPEISGQLIAKERSELTVGISIKLFYALFNRLLLLSLSFQKHIDDKESFQPERSG
jgi:hypothetical protein